MNGGSMAGVLEDVFVAAGCRGFVHAVSLDGAHEAGAGADESVVPASTFKVLVALEAETAFVGRAGESR